MLGGLFIFAALVYGLSRLSTKARVTVGLSLLLCGGSAEEALGNMVASILGATPDNSDSVTGSSFEKKVESIFAVLDPPAVEGREGTRAEYPLLVCGREAER